MRLNCDKTSLSNYLHGHYTRTSKAARICPSLSDAQLRSSTVVGFSSCWIFQLVRSFNTSYVRDTSGFSSQKDAQRLENLDNLCSVVHQTYSGIPNWIIQLSRSTNEICCYSSDGLFWPYFRQSLTVFKTPFAISDQLHLRCMEFYIRLQPGCPPNLG